MSERASGRGKSDGRGCANPGSPHAPPARTPPRARARARLQLRFRLRLRTRLPPRLGVCRGRRLDSSASEMPSNWVTPRLALTSHPAGPASRQPGPPPHWLRRPPLFRSTTAASPDLGARAHAQAQAPAGRRGRWGAAGQGGREGGRSHGSGTRMGSGKRGARGRLRGGACAQRAGLTETRMEGGAQRTQ